MAEPQLPHAVLSEQFQEHMKGRRLKTLVALTYTFDPEFFELEVLPVFLDVGLSHSRTIRALELEGVLHDRGIAVAVYYDRGGLQAGAVSAKLDIRRIGLGWPHGHVFHAKNVFALVKDVEEDKHGEHPQTLLVAALSANLTEAGWWRNVECCHIEEVTSGSASSIADDCRDILKQVRNHARTIAPDQRAIEEVLAFLHPSNVQRRIHRSAGGTLHPRLHSGAQPFPRFLRDATDRRLDGMNLEIISPYFSGSEAGPILGLVEEFRPREVRIFLPTDDSGAACCDPGLAAAIAGIDGARVQWGELPASLLSGGSDRASRRMVHAKVYRFFRRDPPAELVFVGSVNLTNAAHGARNLESGFLVDGAPPRAPQWWLTVRSAPERFVDGVGEREAVSLLTALALRYDWVTGQGDVFWDSEEPRVPLQVAAQNVLQFEIEILESRTWLRLSEDCCVRLRTLLASTSFVTVKSEGHADATVLVQETGMANKPSLLSTLSAADILRLWSMLTAEQRAAFLERHGAELEKTAHELGVTMQAVKMGAVTSIFDSFAGIFHAFDALRQTLDEHLEDERVGAIEYRLLGAKHDSLGALLDKLEDEKTAWGAVERYVAVLCATQLVKEFAETAAELLAPHAGRLKELERRIDEARTRHRAQVGAELDAGEVEWFERHFLRRAVREGG